MADSDLKTTRRPAGGDPRDGREDGVANDALPPFAFRHRLIPAIHAVVPELFGAPGRSLAAVYAAVTALAANAALRPVGDPYSVVAGRLLVRVPGRPDLVLEPAGEDGSGLPFHVWAGRRHDSGRAEVADLSTRDLNDWAERAGIDLGARFPRAVWAFEDEVPRAFRYVADPAATARARESLATFPGGAFADAVRGVLLRLDEHPARGPARSAAPGARKRVPGTPRLREDHRSGSSRRVKNGAGDEG